MFVLSDGEIISAFDNTVTSRPTEEVTLITPTDHEEADTLLFLHVNDMGMKGFNRVMIRTVDTDAFLLSVSLYEKLGLEQHWADFGSGKHRCYLPIHQMILNPVKRDGRPFVFAFIVLLYHRALLILISIYWTRTANGKVSRKQVYGQTSLSKEVCQVKVRDLARHFQSTKEHGLDKDMASNEASKHTTVYRFID